MTIDTIKTIPELKAENITPATCESVGITFKPKPGFSTGENDAQYAIETINKYLENFVMSKKCIACGVPLLGESILESGSFVWGIATGEGNCNNCGYLARAIHRIELPEIEDAATLSNVILQYHPKVLDGKEVNGDE